jgi:predicted acyltransferase (DUF342 family)
MYRCILRKVSLLTALAMVLFICLTAGANVLEEDTDREDLVSFGEKILVERDEVVTGDVVCIGGDIEIYGTVKGDAVSVGGDLILSRTATVEGDAVSIGGRIDMHKNARVRGESLSIGIWLDIDLGGCYAHSSV